VYEIKSILKENLPMILVAVVISSMAGIGLASIRESLYVIPYLIIVVPALNDMVGDFSCILTSRLSTAFKMSYHKMIGKIIKEVFLVAIFSSLYLGFIGWTLDQSISIVQALTIVFLSAISLITVLAVVTYFLTVFFLERNHDPDNLIIPVATSIADVLSVFVFAFMVRLIL
jgi:mgtE-like transporter